MFSSGFCVEFDAFKILIKILIDAASLRPGFRITQTQLHHHCITFHTVVTFPPLEISYIIYHTSYLNC